MSLNGEPVHQSLVTTDKHAFMLKSSRHYCFLLCQCEKIVNAVGHLLGESNHFLFYLTQLK